MPNFQRHFQLALVTGASSGLGKALCELAAKKNIPLLITARHLEPLKTLAKELSPLVPVTTHVCDLGNPLERQTLIALIQQLSPDLIINNAGFGLYGNAVDHSTQEQLNILEVNAAALLELSIEGAKALIAHQKKGVILNISSAAAFFAYPTFSVYAASKAFVNQFSQAFDREVASRGVRVLTACPGQINTNFRQRAAKGYPQKNDSYTLSAEKVAHALFAQIDKEKILNVLDWRYKLAVSVTCLLPRALIRKVQKYLQASLNKRYQSGD